MIEARHTDLQRVAVIGTSCSGKTVFARRLAAQLRQPHIELDALFWGPNWTARPIGAFQALVADVVASDRWVIDGNYSTVQDLVWSRVSSIVWLNYSFRLVMARALRRTVRRSIRREVLFSGNYESLTTAFFSRQSILWWVITTYRRRRRRYRQLLRQETLAQIRVLEFSRPVDAERFLSKLSLDKSPRPEID